MYTTKILVENYLKRVLTEDESNLFTIYNAGVSKYIDSELGSSFADSVEASTKYFQGGSNVLDFSPCVDITKVELLDSDETVLYTYDIDTELELMPRNDTIKYWAEKRYGRFPSGLRNIAVTGKFYFGVLPDDIKFVATVMVASMIQEGTDPGALQSESIEGYSRTFATSMESGLLSAKKTVIEAILNSYKTNDGPLI